MSTALRLPDPRRRAHSLRRRVRFNRDFRQTDARNIVNAFTYDKGGRKTRNIVNDRHQWRCRGRCQASFVLKDRREGSKYVA
jgi:YD repeat-containing protein